jgi:hypothetical protein
MSLPLTSAILLEALRSRLSRWQCESKGIYGDDQEKFNPDCRKAG